MLKKLTKDLEAMDYEVTADHEKHLFHVMYIDDYGTEISHTFRFGELNKHLGLATTSVLNYVVQKMESRKALLSHSNYAY